MPVQNFLAHHHTDAIRASHTTHHVSDQSNPSAAPLTLWTQRKKLRIQGAMLQQQSQIQQKLNCKWVLNLIVRFTSPVCVRTHTSSDAQRITPDWMVYPCRAASAWPLGSVIGVFANQKWRPDYTGGLGNKKPQRNLGVTLHGRNQLQRKIAQCGVGCIRATFHLQEYLR